MTDFITDCSSGSGLVDRAAGVLVAAPLVFSIFVYDLGGAQMAYYTEHHLSPQPGLLLQDDLNVPETITVASSAMTVFVDKAVYG